MKMECIFCRIARGELTSDMLYQDDDMVAFRDIRPVAPVHVLIVPKKHIESAAVLKEDDMPLLARMFSAANRLAVETGVASKGYRLVLNSGSEGGQEVPHLHLHLLGGRQMHGMG